MIHSPNVIFSIHTHTHTQHFIFIIAGFLSWLVPDVPQSVKNEIQKEKLLAYEAIHARKKGGEDFPDARAVSPPQSRRQDGFWQLQEIEDDALAI